MTGWETKFGNGRNQGSTVSLGRMWETQQLSLVSQQELNGWNMITTFASAMKMTSR